MDIGLENEHNNINISVIGTGLLGSAIATRLLSRGYKVTVWNRTSDKCIPLIQLGAQLAVNPVDAANSANYLITVLSDGPTTEMVLLENIGSALAGKTVVQIATIGPDQSRKLASAVYQYGGRYLECPVQGSRPEALAGNLMLMVAGSYNLFDETLPLLKDLSNKPLLLGDIGSAVSIKLAFNQLLASLSHSFSISLHLIQQSGVNIDVFMELLRKTSLYAPTFDKKLERELKGDYNNPNFPTAHLRKDLGLFLKAAQMYNINTTGLDGLHQLLEYATLIDIDDLDYSSLHVLTSCNITNKTDIEESDNVSKE